MFILLNSHYCSEIWHLLINSAITTHNTKKCREDFYRQLDGCHVQENLFGIFIDDEI